MTPLEAMRLALKASGRSEVAPGVHRGRNGRVFAVGEDAGLSPRVFVDNGVPLVETDRGVEGGSISAVLDRLKELGLGGAGLSALGAASLPSEASAMEQLMSPKAAMANPRAAAEHPEERAARLAAERGDTLQAVPRSAEETIGQLADYLSDSVPSDWRNTIHRGVTKAGELMAGPIAYGSHLYSDLMEPDRPQAGLLDRAGASLGTALVAIAPEWAAGVPLGRATPTALDLGFTALPVGMGAYDRPDRSVDYVPPGRLVPGGYAAPHMAGGGSVKDALAKLFKKGTTATDAPDMARRGFLGLNRAEKAPEAETFSGLVPGGVASELASKLNPEMSRRGFLGNTGVAAVSTAFPLNSKLVSGLSTLVEPAAPVNHNAAWTKAMTDWIKDPDLVEDAVGYLGQGGRLSNFMENGTVSKAPSYIKETMNYIAKQPKAIQGDVAKAIDSYFDSMNTLNNAEYSSGLSLESLVDRHPANASLRQQILDEMAPTRQKLLDKLPASWNREVLQSPDYAALKAHDAQVAARISEAGELPGTYADLLEPGQHYRQSEWANIIDQHGEPTYYPGNQQKPLTASQWFDKHRNIALGERAQRAQEAAEVDPRTGMPSDLMYDNVSGADRFARGGLVHLR